MPAMKKPMKKQKGGFFLGLVVGLLVGLALSLGVALYISKVPIPFVDKVPHRSAEQDAAEIERNKNWDPNSSLYGKSPRPSGSASGVVAPVPGVLPPGGLPPETPADPNTASAPASPASTRDPAAILAGQAVVPPDVSTAGGADPFTYFVQAGAYTRMEEADQQRAKLAMLGLTARVTEREQTGRTVYRVRVGPLDNKDAVGPVKEKLDAANIESAVVRVQK